MRAAHRWGVSAGIIATVALASCAEQAGDAGDDAASRAFDAVATPPGDGGGPPSVCGNSKCDEGETCTSCRGDCDCGACGDGTCDAPRESCSSCAADCGPCPVCGDAVCGETEDCSSCEVDCGECGECGDAVCDPARGEDCATCTADCGPCEQCVPETEICDNGLDEDCDGLIDDGCVIPCEETEGYACNGDMGYGDHCAPEDNENGCSPEKFWAWCNRRNDAYPNIWYDFLEQWVEAHCGGEATLTDPDNDGYETFTCTDAEGRIWTCNTPLVLSFDGEPVVFAASEHRFLLDPSLGSARSDWPTAATPWLALDRDADGAITSGAELFGSATPLAGGGLARNGFEALAELDGDGDGVVDERDAAWSQLLVWRDDDGDRVSQPGELSPVAEAGLVSIAVSHRVEARCDARGNCERERGELVWRDAAGRPRRGEVVDVHVKLELDAPACQ